MKVVMTNAFKKSAKKLLRNQVVLVEEAIDDIVKNPDVGELKKGDLADIRVHRFHMYQQLMLLAYCYSEQELVLLSLGTHENFYRDLKKQV